VRRGWKKGKGQGRGRPKCTTRFLLLRCFVAHLTPRHVGSALTHALILVAEVAANEHPAATTAAADAAGTAAATTTLALLRTC
jgi:hypothetical protein